MSPRANPMPSPDADPVTAPLIKTPVAAVRFPAFDVVRKAVDRSSPEVPRPTGQHPPEIPRETQCFDCSHKCRVGEKQDS
jgi:hypothetical protein